MRSHLRQHRDYPSLVTLHGIHRCPPPRSRFPAFLGGMVIGAIIATVTLAKLMVPAESAPGAVRDAAPAVEFRGSDFPLPTPDRPDGGLLV